MWGETPANLTHFEFHIERVLVFMGHSEINIMTEIATENHFFLSYSRRQFYFAEGVALNLQKKGVRVWFDVQELAPGEHWRHEIQRGLDEAQALILIVSEASMQSRYVHQEWEPMIAAKKPIYLVLFEAAHIPKELQDYATAVIDLRGNFQRRLGQLVAVLRGEQAPPKKKFPKPHPFGIPRRISLSLGLVVGMLGLTAAAILLGLIVNLTDTAQGTTEAPVTLFEVMFVCVWLFYLSDTTLDLLRREHTFRQGWIAILLSAPLLMLLLSVYGGLFVLVVLLTYLFTPGLYRWHPTGQAPNWMRRLFGTQVALSMGQVARQLDQQTPPRSQRYTIYAADEDRWIEDQIEQRLAKGGHQRVQHDAVNEGDQHIMVLSNHTPVNGIAHMLQRHQKEALTPVLASNVDVRAKVNALGDFQFIDFRGHTDDQLEAISTLYRHPEEAKIIYGLHVLPISTSILRFPRGVRRFNTFNHLAFLLYVFIVVIVVLTLGGDTLAGNLDEYQSPVLSALIGLFGLVIGFEHFRLGRAVQLRTISLKQFRNRIFRLMGISLFSLTFAIPQIIILATTWQAMKHWLPPSINNDADDYLPHANPHPNRTRAIRDTILIILVFVISALDTLLTG